jgi:uncharacterized protein (TIGR02246 family)
MRVMSLLMLALIAIACQPAERSAQKVEADVESARAKWQSLANADDAAGVAALYTEDAVFVAASGEVYDGRESVRAYCEESFPVSSGLEIKTTDMVFRGDMAAAYGTFSQTIQTPDGDVPIEGKWQTVSVYQPDGSLKIVLHQSMFPAQM